MYEFGHNFGNF